MRSDTHETALNRFVEDVGIAMEQFGFPRMAGKVLGYLLFTHEPHVCSAELVQQLHASKGSISTMTRFLIQTGLIERVGRPGERRDFFRIKGDTWSRILRIRMGQIVDLHEAIERGLAWMPSTDSGPHKRLREMHDFYEFFEMEFKALLDRWEQHKKHATRK